MAAPKKAAKVERGSAAYFHKVEMLRGIAEEMGLDLDAVAVDIVKVTV